MKNCVIASTLIILGLIGTISTTRVPLYESLFKNLIKNELLTPGRLNCALCTFITLASENYAVTHNVSIDDFIENQLCTFFKTPLDTFCQQFVSNFGSQIIDSLANDTSPDHACLKAGLCDNPQCQLVPNKTFDLTFNSPLVHLRIATEEKRVLSWDPAQEIMKILDRYENYHAPDEDFDNDTHSEFLAEARGYHWKGRDCNDFNGNIYPGRRANTSKDVASDNNCNGIYGINASSGISWEETLCSSIKQYGFAVIGDSVGAHFELPWQYFNSTVWNKTTFDDFVPRHYDGFDMPYLSAWTGYQNSTMGLPSNSLYKYLVQNNLCMHRDYQNAGVNGASTIDTPTLVKEAFRRNQTADYPVLTVLELVGNDVCGTYTTPEEFQSGLLEIMNYLDTTLPSGSHLLVMGLANGSVLYDNLYDRLHPIGVTYPDFWDYLTCLDINILLITQICLVNPCKGWLTSNATARNLTTAQAVLLTDIIQQLFASNITFQNYDWDFQPFPFNQILELWEQQGGQGWELIEPVDGFHPNQIFHSMLADHLWAFLNSDHSDWIGPANPTNGLISQIFGDQGGY